jgi:hypothetical protein
VNYQVDWVPDALRELAQIWATAGDRNAVAAASHAIDVALEADPHGIGVVVFETYTNTITRHSASSSRSSMPTGASGC